MDWLKTTFKHRGFIDENLYKANNLQLETALKYFYLFLTPDIITKIVRNTNLYSVEQTGKPL